MPCLCVGVALSGVIQPSRRAWGPCGGRGCSLWRRFEELACFLSPWGPCELWGEANLFSFLSEQHPARVWRSAPALRPPGPRHVSDLGLREAVPRLGLGGCGDPPQVPGVPDGEESALHSASTNQVIALREALLAFHCPASEGGGSMQRRVEEGSLCRAPRAGAEPGTPL